MSSIATLLERNQWFADNRFPGDLPLMPRLGTIVIGCLDPRIDPAHLLGLELGDAPVIRNVGGRVTPAVLRILDLLALAFAAQVGAQQKLDLVVLHHVQCGITRMQDAPGALAAYLGVEESELQAKAVDDPRAAVAVDVAVLAAHPGVSQAFAVSGLVYDVHTGRVEVVVPAGVAA